MSDARTGLIEAARRLLEMAEAEHGQEDVTGAEISTLYEVIGNTTMLLHSYSMTSPLPELRDGAGWAAGELHDALRILEDAWIRRYSTPMVDNVIPLRRAA